MDPPRTPPGDPWDVDRLRLPAGLIGEVKLSKQPPRHGPGEPFLKGPIPYAWMAAACRLPGSGLHVATTSRFLRDRFGRANRWGLEDVAEGLRVSPKTARRGLHAAELAGLLAVDREPGCKLSVSILDRPGPDSGTARPPLFGPIPWAWWLAAMRLDGPALRVATACWMVAGWEWAAEFELDLGGWSDLGLSRFAASRGVKCLERAGLVVASFRPGRSPVVTLLDAPGPPGDGSGRDRSGAEREV
jgi:hypothetical protein